MPYGDVVGDVGQREHYQAVARVPARSVEPVGVVGRVDSLRGAPLVVYFLEQAAVPGNRREKARVLLRFDVDERSEGAFRIAVLSYRALFFAEDAGGLSVFVRAPLGGAAEDVLPLLLVVLAAPHAGVLRAERGSVPVEADVVPSLRMRSDFRFIADLREAVKVTRASSSGPIPRICYPLEAKALQTRMVWLPWIRLFPQIRHEPDFLAVLRKGDDRDDSLLEQVLVVGVGVVVAVPAKDAELQVRAVFPGSFYQAVQRGQRKGVVAFVAARHDGDQGKVVAVDRRYNMVVPVAELEGVRAVVVAPFGGRTCVEPAAAAFADSLLPAGARRPAGRGGGRDLDGAVSGYNRLVRFGRDARFDDGE